MARNLDQLPTEILLLIAQCLADQRGINALVQTSRNLYNSLYHFLCLHNVQHEKGSALLFAAQNGYTGLTTKLLDAGLEISSFESLNEVAYDKSRDEDLSRANPLLMSAQAGHNSTLDLMLSEKRPDQACSRAQLRTVLHWAIRSHNKQLVELMIEHQAPLDPAGTEREAPSALGVAVSSRYYSIIPHFLDLGARAGKHECPCPIEQAIYDDQPSLIALLFEHGVRLNCDCGLCYIASRGDTATLQLLIDHGIDLSVYGNAALLYAIMEGQYDMTKLLIDNGASPNYNCRFTIFKEDDLNVFWYDAIDFAVHFERVDILKLLLEKGAHPGYGIRTKDDNYSEEILSLLSKGRKRYSPSQKSLESLAWFGNQIREEDDDLRLNWPGLVCAIDDAYPPFPEAVHRALES
ncbi:ankyrin repeat protein [Aspergillus steynii IBT 23096]|uniref:Ankyrin repeat protein n=1 Tax=Aspergillus steynii IBT 23096 TaxID=1392250 RepID=A0A2I2FUK7_9EURO|nr:ankyrin repeat protein [Aspergillus steynii IBT 23096]PLB44329.1 ankyrin repeat protein [Aspergillus steynii IBT 23096]